MGHRRLDLAAILSSKPGIAEVLRGDMAYRDIAKKYGVSVYCLGMIAHRIGVRRSWGKPSHDATRLRISQLPRVCGTREARWRVYLSRMREVYGSGWYDLTYWAAVANKVRLYAGVAKVSDMLPLLRGQLDREAKQRVRAASSRKISSVEYLLP
jgi:hypothetical protein